MTLSSKRELIQAIRKVYGKSTKAQKSAHLDHLELVTGLKRNYLNRLLLSGYKTKRRKPGRRSRYASDPEFKEHLLVSKVLPIFLTPHYFCACSDLSLLCEAYDFSPHSEV